MKKILLCFGGKSFEHDISIITALIVLKKYRGKFNLLPIYISKNQEWFYFAGKDLNVKCFKDFERKYKQNGFKKVSVLKGKIVIGQSLFKTEIKVDGALNCCHGGYGEDGGLNSFLESNNICVSSGSASALAICMDKVLTKIALKGLNVPVIDYFTFTRDEYKKDEDYVLKKAGDFGFPLIIKPSLLGSSIGIKVAHNQKEFEEGVQVALEFDNNILVEKAILEDMKEYNIALMKKDKNIIVSKIDKVIKNDEILSFQDKYIGDGNCNKYCAKNQGEKSRGKYFSDDKKWEKVPSKIKKKITKISLVVYEKLALKGVVRFDFIVDKNDNVFLNEINTVPGSLGYYFFVPQAFKNMGGFIDSLINESIIEKENMLKIKNEYITNIIK